MNVVVYGEVGGAIGQSTDLGHVGSWCDVSEKTLQLVGLQS